MWVYFGQNRNNYIFGFQVVGLKKKLVSGYFKKKNCFAKREKKKTCCEEKSQPPGYQIKFCLQCTQKCEIINL